MLIVLHLFTHEDTLNWRSELLSKIIGNMVRMIRNRFEPSYRVQLVTDQEHIARAHDGRLIILSQKEGTSNTDSLLNTLSIQKDTDLMLVDLHNPFLSPDDLEKALTHYLRNAVPLLSVRQLNYPLNQVKRYATIEGIGRFHFLETEPIQLCPKHLTPTRPFFLPWETICPGTAPGVYMRINCEQGIRFMPWNPGYLKDKILYIFETPGQARLAVPTTYRETGLYQEGIPGLTLHTEGTKILLNLPQSEGCEIQLTSFGFKTETDPARYQTVIHNAQAALPFSLFADCSGASIILTHGLTKGATADLELHFEPGGILWHRNQRGEAYNLLTEERIVGRQQSPEVYEFSGDFIVGRCLDLQNRDRLLANHGMESILMTGPYVKLQDEIHHLQYTILKDMPEEKRI